MLYLAGNTMTLMLEISLVCSEGSRRFDNQVSLVTGQLMSEVYDAGVLADVQQAQRIVASCLTATTFRGLLDNVSHALASAHAVESMNHGSVHRHCQLQPSVSPVLPCFQLYSDQGFCIDQILLLQYWCP